tara:strand:+ start:56 stop:976 length:921 start_codon:yes stop_codon:yes gene_type:complete
MSKIKVDQIESSSTNVKLSPKGTNAVQIKGAGSDDAAVQLSSASGTHGVKIKSPNHSAGQSHTLVLPDNNIETNKFLKVKSITNAGNQAVGQLEFASIASPDLTQIDGSHFTSGTMPSARFGQTFNASSGAYLSLQTSSIVSGTYVTKLQFSLDANSLYLIHGRKVKMYSSSSSFEVRFLKSNADGTASTSTMDNCAYYFNSYNETSTQQSYSYQGHTGSSGYFQTGVSSDHYIMSIQVSTFPRSGMVDWFCMGTDPNNSASTFPRSEGTVRISDNLSGAAIAGIEIGSAFFDVGTEFYVYKYGET